MDNLARFKIAGTLLSGVLIAGVWATGAAAGSPPTPEELEAMSQRINRNTVRPVAGGFNGQGFNRAPQWAAPADPVAPSAAQAQAAPASAPEVDAPVAMTSAVAAPAPVAIAVAQPPVPAMEQGAAVALPLQQSAVFAAAPVTIGVSGDAAEATMRAAPAPAVSRPALIAAAAVSVVESVGDGARVEIDRNTGVAVASTMGGGAIEYRQGDDEGSIPVYFASNSAVLTSAAIEQLQIMCVLAPRLTTDRRMMVIGHADRNGDAAYNLGLSQRRANEVRRHLAEECGVAESAIDAVGFGETYANQTRTVAGDRRVEFRMIEPTS